MNNVEKLQRTRTFSTIRVESAPDGNSHWMYMHNDAASGSRPCFRSDLLDEMWSFTSSITLRESERQVGRLRHFVLASSANAFNLGGDLDLFSKLIRSNDREHLLAYARRCIDGVYTLHTGLGGDVRTIALLQGDALGGGLEMALACHTIVAEEGVQMGFPEPLFGLFPGMGAFPLLARRMPPHAVRDMMLDGTTYSSQQLHGMGVVDVLVPRGDGVRAVQDLIRRQQRNLAARFAVDRLAAVTHPLSRDALIQGVDIWVQTAMQLDERHLRTMERLIRAQQRLAATSATRSR